MKILTRMRRVRFVERCIHPPLFRKKRAGEAYNWVYAKRKYAPPVRKKSQLLFDFVLFGRQIGEALAVMAVFLVVQHFLPRFAELLIHLHNGRIYGGI